MCGIVYFHNYMAEGAIKPILKRYEEQKSRGKEGFGAITFSLDTGVMSHYVRRADEADMKKLMEDIGAEKDVRNNACLFHHRFPTSTPNLAECAHPIHVKHAELEFEYYVVHNGVISNEDELKPIHNALGYEYTTEIVKRETIETKFQTYTYDEEMQFNDSESLAIELARHIEGKSKSVDAKGTMAFIVLQTKDGVVKKLYYGRNFGNPLYREALAEGILGLKSQGAATESVDTHKLFCYDYATGETTDTSCVFQPYAITSTHSRHARGWDDRDAEDYGIGTTMMGFRTLDGHRQVDTHRQNVIVLPSGKVEEEDEMSYHTKVTPADVEAYLEDVSVTDFTIEELLADGHTLQDLYEQTQDESFVVDDLIDYETPVIGSPHIEELQMRKELLGVRMGRLDKRIKQEEELEKAIEEEGVTSLA